MCSDMEYNVYEKCGADNRELSCIGMEGHNSCLIFDSFLSESIIECFLRLCCKLWGSTLINQSENVHVWLEPTGDGIIPETIDF